MTKLNITQRTEISEVIAQLKRFQWVTTESMKTELDLWVKMRIDLVNALEWSDLIDYNTASDFRAEIIWLKEKALVPA